MFSHFCVHPNITKLNMRGVGSVFLPVHVPPVWQFLSKLRTLQWLDKCIYTHTSTLTAATVTHNSQYVIYITVPLYIYLVHVAIKCWMVQYYKNDKPNRSWFRSFCKQMAPLRKNTWQACTISTVYLCLYASLNYHGMEFTNKWYVGNQLNPPKK